MRLLGIRSFLSRSNVSKAWRSSKIHRGSTEAVSLILLRWSSGNHVATPPMFDSKVGFNDYEKERREFRLDVPEYFNFANVLDEWAQKEKRGERKDGHPGFWWADDKGHEVKWSFQQLAEGSRRTANVLTEAGKVQRGDRVMVILPRLPNETVHGGYSSWGQWQSCTVTCGGGVRYRYRTCTNPPPQHVGNDCFSLGPSYESESCNTNNCPIRGGYSSWEPWSACNASCGGGSRSRSRTCTNPPPQYGGNDCSALGPSSVEEDCNVRCCTGSCQIAQQYRTDCGRYGMSRETCLSKGCCHDDTVPEGIPHCYHKCNHF